MDVKKYFMMVFMNFSQVTEESEQLFKSILAIHGSSSLNCLFLPFTYWYVNLSFSYCFLGSSLSIPDVISLSVTYIANIFSHVMTCHLVKLSLLYKTFEGVKVISIFLYDMWFSGQVSNKTCLRSLFLPQSHKDFYVFSSCKTFKVLQFIHIQSTRNQIFIHGLKEL